MDCIIYKIINDVSSNVYIGSTIDTLQRRLQAHKDKKNCSSYQIIKEGISRIVEIEKCHKDIRFEREQYWIDNTNNCVNMKRALMTSEDRKEQRKRATIKARQKHNIYKNKIYHYRNSWGGDERRNNNLLCIDLNVFH